MTAQPKPMTEAPQGDAAERVRRVREGLSCLHLSGAIFIRAEFSAPWAYASPESEEIMQFLQPRGRRVVLFHIFTEGACRIAVEGGDETDIRAGDIAIFPAASRHRMGDPAHDRPVPVREMMPPLPWTAFPVIRHGGGGAPTEMVCGYLLCDDLPLNPVLGSLPPLLRVRPTPGGPLGRWVQASVDYAFHAGSAAATADPLLQRLPELLFMECVCEYVEGREMGDAGWLAALADPIVGRALACMHRAPEEGWTVELLARKAATSRSVLDERFRALLGRAPMSYLTAWRLQLAARRLRSSTDTLAEISEAVGYASEASFSRAFKRHAGVSPGQWREAG